MLLKKSLFLPYLPNSTLSAHQWVHHRLLNFYQQRGLALLENCVILKSYSCCLLIYLANRKNLISKLNLPSIPISWTSGPLFSLKSNKVPSQRHKWLLALSIMIMNFKKNWILSNPVNLISNWLWPWLTHNTPTYLLTSVRMEYWLNSTFWESVWVKEPQVKQFKT
jgi:hypothetical protein